jgi:putative glutamine amidotransferase
MRDRRPMIGISCDVAEPPPGAPPTVRARFQLGDTYCRSVWEAGGVPVILPAIVEAIGPMLEHLDGVVISGGDDIDTRPFGVALHPQARVMHPQRQAFELALLAALDTRRQTPVLGVCLGMQLMGLHAGAGINQHLGDTIPTTADDHRNDAPHEIHWLSADLGVATGLPAGRVASNHHQALLTPGSLRELARSPDGVIEAVDDPSRPFYLGVQWHPERTADRGLGLGVFERLVRSAGGM